ncbi:M67 family peptidase [Halosegnis longus]|uniref:M67 family peptidase n=2 Tax=Halosegnis longus TaxID=2216012 RepID=A0AAJ4RA68_9EURY|nr:M67 family peptidase [Salella cibi]
MRLTDEARGALFTHARDGRPEEVAGVLAGPDSETVTRVERAENVADDPRRRYELDPVEQAEILDAVETRGETVVGFYHSHPRDPPVPSATDERLATWDGYVYLIVSPDESSLAAYRWTGERFESVRLD